MCGLIGAVNAEPLSQTLLDPDALLDEARGLTLEPLTALEQRLMGLETRVQGLFRFAQVYGILVEPGRARTLSLLGDVLDALAASSEALQANPQQVERQERLSAVSIRARDVAWRLKQDLLPNVERIGRLGQLRNTSADEPLGAQRAYELWKLNTLLNGIDRLEVRGRDSAGFALQVFFPSPEALESVLEAPGLRAQLTERTGQADFVNLSVRRFSEPTPSLLFTYKVALEIGEMGENVASLRAALTQDALLQRALDCPGVKVLPLAHTRWASNGIISEPNCHPLDNQCVIRETGAILPCHHATVAVLNGDIDNYQPLKEALEAETERGIAPAITTDAKIIPLIMDRYVEQGLSFEEAFRKAVASFQGSMAIAVTTSLAPGKVFLAQRGSGQSIYIGFTEGGFLFASELYGLVEETRTFLKMDGEKERVPGDPTSAGQLAVLDSGWDGGSPSLTLRWYDGTPLPDPRRTLRTAEITTRDINRAGYPHFMLKEITESVQSVKRTLRGKYRLEGERVEFTFARELLSDELLQKLRRGGFRRILCIGQGTASVAGNGIAAIMTQVLAGSGLEIASTKATELSGFYLAPRMDETLVVAVSQSGTTTDTNRTVDLARERGAKVIAIVNRRNSDLVYKADAVLYTSDGRDVEMSVASTKAFYAQVAAGTLLALALARELGTLTSPQLLEEVRALEQLPTLIGRVLQDHEGIKALAERTAVRHRHWAVVGNGANRVAAEEIRIKLSELCYKAIACDYTEDKKHIDLSSEPLVIVCAAGLGSSNTQDVVKEVAIFKAHKACPLVITQEGETRFDPYAAGVIRVPRGAGRLSFVLSTVVGHLWGYYAACALDGQAQGLKRLRARSVALFERLRHEPGGTALEPLCSAMRAELSSEIRGLEAALISGAMDSGLPAASAVKLLLLLQAITGRTAFDEVVLELGGAGLVSGAQLFEVYLAGLTTAINDLTRPIDAIKHQAKTVTVGISRSSAPAGVLFEALEGLGIPAESLLPSHAECLISLSPLVDEVVGSVHYALEKLTDAGEPGPDTRIRVLHKTGIVATVASRADQGATLLGSKRLIALQRRLFAGAGSSDGKTLVMFPLLNNGRLSGLMLLHVRFAAAPTLEQRLNALKSYRNHYERLVGMVTENSLPWSDTLLERLPVELMFEGSSEAVMRVIRQG